MDDYYALIMAGGGGTRLWPMSRQSRPKQALPLVGDRTMFQLAVERLKPLFPPERIIVATVEAMVANLRQQAPSLPAGNFIIEPEGRDTAPAIGLAALHIAQRNPEAIMAVLTADHFIRDTEGFRVALAAARDIASEGGIVTLGIKPSFASTGFGYIEHGESSGKVNGLDTFHVNAFVEKPPQATAETFFAGGRHSWNSGMFIWQVSRFQSELARLRPKLAKQLDAIAKGLANDTYDETLAKVWPDIERISVDYAVMEGAQNVRVIPVSIGWDDVGSWSALLDINATDENGNVALGEEAPYFLDTRGALVASDKLVAVIGVDDIVIIDTGDALLVCKRDRAQDVKAIVERLKQENRTALL